MAPTPAELRARMVDGIRAQHRGELDERVLDAMRTVPRHAFVDDVVDLDAAHDDRPVPVPGFDPESLTTSVSAPGLVAWMLHELHLAPGMRVLEVGAGRGYNAALLAELGCTVTTIEIDPTLAGPTRERLGRLGYGDVEVVLGDGDAGVAERAPFDRVIGTVGCNDLSPAWFDQLAPDGFLLVPVRHGSRHPLVRATPDRRSTFLGLTGFVAVLGAQEGTIASGDDLDHLDLSTVAAEWVPKGTGAGAWVIPRVHHDEVMLV